MKFINIKNTLLILIIILIDIIKNKELLNSSNLNKIIKKEKDNKIKLTNQNISKNSHKFNIIEIRKNKNSEFISEDKNVNNQEQQKIFGKNSIKLEANKKLNSNKLNLKQEKLSKNFPEKNQTELTKQISKKNNNNNNNININEKKLNKTEIKKIKNLNLKKEIMNKLYTNDIKNFKSNRENENKNTVKSDEKIKIGFLSLINNEDSDSNNGINENVWNSYLDDFDDLPSRLIFNKDKADWIKKFNKNSDLIIIDNEKGEFIGKIKDKKLENSKKNKTEMNVSKVSSNVTKENFNFIQLMVFDKKKILEEKFIKNNLLERDMKEYIEILKEKIKSEENEQKENHKKIKELKEILINKDNEINLLNKNFNKFLKEKIKLNEVNLTCYRSCLIKKDLLFNKKKIENNLDINFIEKNKPIKEIINPKKENSNTNLPNGIKTLRKSNFNSNKSNTNSSLNNTFISSNYFLKNSTKEKSKNKTRLIITKLKTLEINKLKNHSELINKRQNNRNKDEIIKLQIQKIKNLKKNLTEISNQKTKMILDNKNLLEKYKIEENKIKKNVEKIDEMAKLNKKYENLLNKFKKEIKNADEKLENLTKEKSKLIFVVRKCKTERENYRHIVDSNLFQKKIFTEEENRDTNDLLSLKGIRDLVNDFNKK